MFGGMAIPDGGLGIPDGGMGIGWKCVSVYGQFQVC